MANQDSDLKFRQTIESLRHKDRISILFVCLGNICRSTAAETVMMAELAATGYDAYEGAPDDAPASATWVIDSAGTGDYHIGDLADPRMRAMAKQRGYCLLHRARQVCESDFFDFDLIIGMDAANVRNLLNMSPTPETDSKIVPFARFFPDGKFLGHDHVPDPYYSGAEGFTLVIDMLECGCKRIISELRPASINS